MKGLVPALLLAAVVPAGPLNADPPPLSRFRDYLRIDTSNPPGNERAGAVYLKRILDEAGIPSEVFEPAPGRANLYARLRASQPAPKGLVLHHHIDVVPASGKDWKRPPFSGEQTGNVLYGRGTLDDKGLGILFLEAFLEMAKESRKGRLHRDIVFLATADEERGGLHGVSAIIRDRPQWLEGVGFALGEGGSVAVVVDKPRFFGIEIQHKGALWLRLTAEGRGGHASVPESIGASERLLQALAHIFPYRSTMEMTPSVMQALEAQDHVKRARQRPTAREIAQWVHADPGRAGRLLAPADAALLADTCAVTRLGNDSGSTNALAHRAWAEVDCRLLPGRSPEVLLAALKGRLADPAIRIEVLLSRGSGPASRDSELFQIVRKTLLQRFPGVAVGADVSTGTSENGVFRSMGIETYGVTPFRVNYYDLAGIHGTDERIRTDWFLEGVETVTRIVKRFGGKS